MCTHYLFTLDGEPLYLSTSWEPLEEVNRIHTLTIAEATQLGLHPGIACILVERTYYEGGTPLETADIVLPPHYRAAYQIPLEQPGPDHAG